MLGSAGCTSPWGLHVAVGHEPEPPLAFAKADHDHGAVIREVEAEAVRCLLQIRRHPPKRGVIGVGGTCFVDGCEVDQTGERRDSVVLVLPRCVLGGAQCRR